MKRAAMTIRPLHHGRYCKAFFRGIGHELLFIGFDRYFKCIRATEVALISDDPGRLLAHLI
jgi:hypothetical protein